MDLIRFKYGENNINTGPLKQIPEICIDHFTGDDLNSSVFFLSHAHTDHLVGLETEAFMRRLRQPGVKLYCHPLTPILLGSFSRYLQGPEGIEKLIAANKIEPLDVNKPKLIKIPKLTGHLDVTVTLFPAGHCPGSVMFMFETKNIRILHTGDFRLTLDDLKRMKLLHQNGFPKPIDQFYIDTTFCCKSAALFPNRKNVLKEAFGHIKDWIGKSTNHIVDLRFSAKFAHEYVLMEIFKEFHQKVHVTLERQGIYQHIPDLLKIVTLNPQTQFHLCNNRDCVEGADILTVRLSSMWYTKRKSRNEDSFISWRGSNNMTLCYSMHSSLGEIAETITYLKPKIVTPLVLPSSTDLEELKAALCSATEVGFKYEDYRSSQNDLPDTDFPDVPCEEERDETDELFVDEENVYEIDENQDGSHQAELSAEKEDMSPSPSKRIKLSDETIAAWTYTFSPSSSKNSQSSDDALTSDGSQEPRW